MISARLVKSKAVYVGARRVGKAVECKFSYDLKRLDGVWIDTGITGIRFIDAEKISRINERGIVSDTKGDRLKIKPDPLFIRAKTNSGKRAGAIVGAMIDEISLIVVSLELSLSVWTDLTRGYARVNEYTYDAQRKVVSVPDAIMSMEVF